MSTYFGRVTMVLKFPVTSAASTNGLQRYSGFCAVVVLGEGGIGGICATSCGGNVVDVGVGDRLGPRGVRAIDRL